MRSAMPGATLTLMLFLAAHTLLSLDRAVMVLLLEPIRREFELTDNQLALLTGIGFSLFFAVAGIPIGRLVDRYNRRNILAGSVMLFSFMTAISAAAGSFIQVLAARSLVGVGEAGGAPAMGSMLADLYPPERRASAIAIFYAGAPLGTIVAFLFGGYIAATQGWRMAFLAAGIPGVLLAFILMVAVREPTRSAQPDGSDQPAPPSLGETIRFAFGQRALRHVMITPILTSSATSGIFTFAASFFMRSHALEIHQVGLLLAVVYGSAGVVGAIVGGRIVDRLARRGEGWRAWYCTIANTLAAPAIALMVLAPGIVASAFGLAAFSFLTYSTYGPLLAMLQSLVAGRMRGTITAIFYLLSYLLGAASGPQIVGATSDLLRLQFGEQSLRYAMLTMPILYIWAAVHFYYAGKSLLVDFLRARALDAPAEHTPQFSIPSNDLEPSSWQRS
jgi:predicted MFS family arabinose efflux permease